MGDDKNIVAVVFDLGPLMGVEHVFHHQRVQLKAPADFRHHRHILQAVDVQPQRAVAWLVGAAGGQAGKGGFLVVLGAEFNQQNARFGGFGFANMHQFARRVACVAAQPGGWVAAHA